MVDQERMKPLGDFSWMTAVHSVPSSTLTLLAGTLQRHAAYKTTSDIYCQMFSLRTARRRKSGTTG